MLMIVAAVMLFNAGLTAQSAEEDHDRVRFGLFAEFDGSINDVLGIRVQMGKDHTILAQGSYSSSFFNNDDHSNGNTRDGTYHNTFILLGYERRLLSYLDADILFYSSVKYSWYRSKRTEEVYHYDPITKDRVLDGLAGTESKDITYGVFTGIGIEYHASEQLSIELMKRLQYSTLEQYRTYATSQPGRSVRTEYGVDDVFLNIIFYF
jgi:hypothetical protein